MKLKSLLLPWMFFASNSIQIVLSSSPTRAEDADAVEVEFWKCSKYDCRTIKCCEGYSCQRNGRWGKKCVKSTDSKPTPPPFVRTRPPTKPPTSPPTRPPTRPFCGSYNRSCGYLLKGEKVQCCAELTCKKLWYGNRCLKDSKPTLPPVVRTRRPTPTRPPTKPPTKPLTRSPTKPPTKPLTRSPTEPPTKPLTRSPTLPSKPRCASYKRKCGYMWMGEKIECCAGLACKKYLFGSQCEKGPKPTGPPFVRTRRPTVPRTRPPTMPFTKPPPPITSKPTEAPTETPSNSPISKPTEAPIEIPSNSPTISLEPTIVLFNTTLEPTNTACGDLLEECGGDSEKDCCSGLTCISIARTRIVGAGAGKKVCIKKVLPPPPKCIKKEAKCTPFKKGSISLFKCCPGLICKRKFSNQWSSYSCAESKPVIKPTKKPTSTCSRTMCSKARKCCPGLRCSNTWWGKCIGSKPTIKPTKKPVPTKKPTSICSRARYACSSKRKCCAGLTCSNKRWGWGTCTGLKPTIKPTKKPAPICSKARYTCSKNKKCCAGLTCSNDWWGTCKGAPTCVSKGSTCYKKKKCCAGLTCSNDWWGTCKGM